MNSDTDAFLKRKIDWGGYRPFKEFDSYFAKSKFVLVVAKKELASSGLSAQDIAIILRKKFSVKRATHQAVRGTLDRNLGREVDATFNESGVKLYHALLPAEQEIVLYSEEINPEFNADELIFPQDLFKGSRSYLQRIALEINGCFRDNYYTACAIMLRRLFETLIVEVYESKGLEKQIKDTEGNYFSLEKLITYCINDSNIKLSKSTKKYLPLIKLFGDQGAHNRKYLGRKSDIAKYSGEIRIAAEEFLHELV